MTQLLHPPYSPGLAPCDFFLFPRMKKVLKGKRFAELEEVKKKTTEALKGITLQEFQYCFEMWETHLDRCIASNGQYLKAIELVTPKIKYTIFYYKIPVSFGPPTYYVFFYVAWAKKT